MSKIRINKLKVKNYRSFGEEQEFDFPDESYQKPVAIIGYNNAGKTNLMNAILYGIGEEFVSEKTFEKSDLHNLDYGNLIEIKTDISATVYGKTQYGKEQTIGGNHRISTVVNDGELFSKAEPSFFGANKHYNIFYINFHKIKDEISIKKTSWGKLSSFLAKHIQKVVEKDNEMLEMRAVYESMIKSATNVVLEDSKLSLFIESIRKNYHQNLRKNNCIVDFGLPDYEDIFLQMMFKIGLNGDKKNLIPIEQFGDGYVSMFVMAVIQAIAETNTEDNCLFLFEEPESFLHENHQEYFYKMVLCKLAKNHQVIYTTHSDKMIDFFDTKGIIRIEFDEEKKQTEWRYNDISVDKSDEYGDYNNYIQRIEPNLNKILFSKKVILVEGPNDVLVYKYAIEQKIKEKIVYRNDIDNKDLYAQTYLNFENIVIIPHHGKTTVHVLIELCKHFKVDFFVITDLDFEDGNLIKELKAYISENAMKSGTEYMSESNPTKKGEITKNWKLLKAAQENIHFNVPKLEKVIGYIDDTGNPIVDKDSMGIWEAIRVLSVIPQELFPKELEEFLEFHKLENSSI